MSDRPPELLDDDRLVEEQLAIASQRVLRTGGGIAAVMGFTAFVAICVLKMVIQPPDGILAPPAAFTVLVGAFGILVTSLARAGRLRGTLAAVVMLSFVSLPTLFFIVAAQVSPIGACGYVTGPFTYFYGFTIVLTGFLLSPGLAVAAGALAALEFAGVFLAVRETLHALPIPEVMNEMQQDQVWGFKFAMLFGTGVGTGGIGIVARDLVKQVLREQREVMAVGKLFGQFVSTEVRDKILKERAGLTSERCTCAVLFSDVRSFTTYSEKTDPAEIVTRLNRYFERMVEAIEHEGGVVDKFIGDAVMATFGGILPLERPAISALNAARAMRTSLVQLNAEWAREGKPAFDNGIGLHFGEVIQGPIGSERRREFTVIGDTVNIASRVEGLTKDLQTAIVVTDALRAALDDDARATLTPLGRFPVKGRSEPLDLFGGEALGSAPEDLKP